MDCRDNRSRKISMGIIVQLYHSGIIQTDFSRALYQTEEARERALQSIPLNRLGQADECADVVSFLVSSILFFNDSQSSNEEGRCTYISPLRYLIL